jgi:hypothetical protein
MGLEMIFILGASALGIAVIGVVVYRAIPDRSVPVKTEVEKSQTPQKSLEVEASPESEPISEAPPPFSEDSTPSGHTGVALPTDTNAIGSATRFLAIQVPKTAQRTVTKTKRRRRTTKTRTFSPELGTAIPSIDPADKKEPSAA